MALLPLSVHAIEWFPIVWYGPKRDNGAQIKEALLIEAKIANVARPFFFQLDTGAADSMLFLRSIANNTDIAPFLKMAKSGSVPYEYPDTLSYGIKMQGSILGSSYSEELFYISKVAGLQNTDLIGMIGLTGFLSEILVIDFIENRVTTISNRLDIEQIVKSPISYEHYQMVDGVPTAPILFTQKLQGHFAIDTGASQFGLIVFDLEKWMTMTGRTLDDSRNAKANGSTWSYSLKCTLAPALGNISLKTISLGELDIAYCLENDQPMIVPGIDGMLGNAAFFDKAVIIFDQSTRSFGVSFKEISPSLH